MSSNQSLDRGLQMLALLDEASEPLGVREIGRRLQISPTIAQRLVQTLVDHDFAKQEEQTRRYSIGYRALSLGRSLLTDEDLIASALPELRRLARDHHLNTFLSVISGSELVYLLTEQSAGPIAIRSKPGTRAHFHSTAMGKMLLAGRDPAEVGQLLGPDPLVQVTSQTITDRRALTKQITDADARGYALAFGENLEGVTSVAGRVRNATGKTIAAISVAYAPSLLPGAELADILRQVIEAANAISTRLGCPKAVLDTPKVTLEGQSDVA